METQAMKQCICKTISWFSSATLRLFFITYPNAARKQTKTGEAMNETQHFCSFTTEVDKLRYITPIEMKWNKLRV